MRHVMDAGKNMPTHYKNWKPFFNKDYDPNDTEKIRQCRVFVQFNTRDEAKQALANISKIMYNGKYLQAVQFDSSDNASLSTESFDVRTIRQFHTTGAIIHAISTEQKGLVFLCLPNIKLHTELENAFQAKSTLTRVNLTGT